MSSKLDEIVCSAKQLDMIPEGSLAAYKEKAPIFIKNVNESMSSHQSLDSLIGPSGVPMMLDNHSNHAAFMATVFSLGNYTLLARTVPWVYRTYHAHGFSYDYFPAELGCWIDAIKQNLSPDCCAEIISVYEWMLDVHETMISLSQDASGVTGDDGNEFLQEQRAFLEGILEGDHKTCLTIAEAIVASAHDITPLYVYVIQPSMYEVGRLWESGKISVAEEHLASAIVSRVIASTDMLEFLSERKPKKAIVTSAPNEYHEIGAWMVSDVIESQGWDVKYLGANTPASDLINLVRSFRPDAIAISATMAFNVESTRAIIDGIHGDDSLSKTHVLVGGRIFNEVEGLWETIGADYYSPNVADLKGTLSQIEKAG